MSEYQLVLTESREESKAKRILWFFKPKELVTGEPFDIYLTFENVGTAEFPGGECEIQIAPPTFDIFDLYRTDIPSIKPKERKTAVFKNFNVRFSGFVHLDVISAKDVSGNDAFGEDPSPYRFYLMVASHEELYQKYAVVVAIFFSVLATILTIANVLVSIFR